MTSLVESPDRVAACVGRFTRTVARPGDETTLDRCLDDVEALRREDRITDEQREALRLLLLGIGMHAG